MSEEKSCGYVANSKVCSESATHHLIFDGGNAMPVVCLDHYNEVMEDEGKQWPEDHHPLTDACTMPESRWLYSTPDEPGRCFIPKVDVEMMNEVVNVEDLDAAS